MLLGLCGAALAQEAAPKEASEAELPAVVVKGGGAAKSLTARESSMGVLGDKAIVDTPFTVNAYTRALIERQGAQTVSQVMRNDPALTGVQAAGSFSGFGFGLRGFAAGSDNLTFDGLGPGVVWAGARGQLFSIESVEVLKGPTGMLTGFSPFSSVGGSVNLVPKKPLNAPLTDVTLGWASASLITAHADISRRFGKDNQFGVRVNAASERGKTFYDGEDERDVLDVAFDWRATKNLVVSGSLNYTDILNKRYQNAYGISSSYAGNKLPDAPDAGRNLMQPWTYFGQNYRYGYVRADWEVVPDWMLTAQWVQGKSQRSPYVSPGTPTLTNVNGDFTLSPSYVAPVADTYPEFSGQALFARGKLNTGSVKHELTAGYTRSGYEQYGGSGTVTPSTFATNLYNPRYYAEPALSYVPANLGLQSKVTSQGVVLADNLMFGERWALLLGARHAKVTYAAYNTVTDVATKPPQDKSKTAPLVGLTFKPTPQSTAYLSYAKGLELLQSPTTAINKQDVLPTDTRQIELGFKQELTSGALVSVSLFDIVKGLGYTNTANYYVLDGEQRNRGLEFSIAGNVTRHLQLSGGMLLLDAKIENNGTASQSGKRPFGVPRITLPMYADYELAAVPGLFLSFGLTHFGQQYVNLDNTREIPGWTRFDAGLQYKSKLGGQAVTWTANVENLTDKRYWASANGGSLSLGSPRIFKLSAKVSF